MLPIHLLFKNKNTEPSSEILILIANACPLGIDDYIDDCFIRVRLNRDNEISSAINVNERWSPMSRATDSGFETSINILNRAKELIALKFIKKRTRECRGQFVH